MAIPRVSRDASTETMRAAADWLASRLAFANARVEETAGHPVVRGEWLGAPGAPTVLVYGHFDVQPTGDARGVAEPAVRADASDGDAVARPRAPPTTRARSTSC